MDVVERRIRRLRRERRKRLIRLTKAVYRALSAGGIVIDGHALWPSVWRAHDDTSAAGVFLPHAQTPEYLTKHLMSRYAGWSTFLVPIRRPV